MQLWSERGSALAKSRRQIALAAYLNLIHVWRPDFGIILHFLDMADAKVADANTPYFALVVQPLKRQPHLLPLLHAAIGAVYEEQVDIAVLPRVNLLYTG